MIDRSPFEVQDYRRLVAAPWSNKHMPIIGSEVAMVPPRNPPPRGLGRLIRWWFS